LKYLLISVILGFGFLLVYSRLRPYIQFARKLVRLVNASGEQTSQSTPSSGKQVEKKLIQCGTCGTFIPADRAFGRAGLASYCSAECLEKAAASKEQKLAG